MGAWENKCQISQNDTLHMKFSEFYLCFHNPCEILHLFSWAPMRNSLWCYYRQLIISTALENFKNKAILFKLFWYKVFVLLKLKLLNFLLDSVLIWRKDGDVAKRATLLSRTTSFIYTLSNRPLPSPKYLHFQNEAPCTIFLVKMSFSWMRMKNHFNKKGWVLNLVLMERPGRTRKWPISEH